MTGPVLAPSNGPIHLLWANCLLIDADTARLVVTVPQVAADAPIGPGPTIGPGPDPEIAGLDPEVAGLTHKKSTTGAALGEDGVDRAPAVAVTLGAPLVIPDVGAGPAAHLALVGTDVPRAHHAVAHFLTPHPLGTDLLRCALLCGMQP